MLPPFNGFTGEAGSTIFLELTFLDRFGAAVTPTALTQEIWDVTNARQLLAPTSVTPPSSGNTLEVPIPATLNAMTEVGAKLQLNRVIIRTTYPDGSLTAQPFLYRLANPEYLPGELPA